MNKHTVINTTPKPFVVVRHRSGLLTGDLTTTSFAPRW